MARKSASPKKPRPVSDRKLRELVALAYADPTLGADTHIENMHKIVAWIKTGEAPKGTEKPKLKLVPSAP